MVWLLMVLGGVPGRMNLLWGGFLSCLSEFGIVGVLWHNINCHEKGCWRPGHMKNGSRVCHRHRKRGESHGADAAVP
jgi:hypothetical protein